MAKTNRNLKGVEIHSTGSGTGVYASWTALTDTVKGKISNIKVRWSYKITNELGSAIWIYESWDTVSKNATRSNYSSAPDTATQVRMQYKLTITKSASKKNKSTQAEVVYSFSRNAPVKPTGLSADLSSDYTLTCLLTNSDTNADYANFKYFKVDSEGEEIEGEESGWLAISPNSNTVRTTFPVNSGYTYFVVVKTKNGETDTESVWSDPVYPSGSSPESLPPDQVTGVTAVAESSSRIYISWDSADNAAAYEIEYALESRYLGTSFRAGSTTVYITHEYISVDTGNTYYFRVRATNSEGLNGEWSSVVSATVSMKPDAPTTWTLGSSYKVGDAITFYWTHNSTDGSKPTQSTVDLYLNSATTPSYSKVINHTWGEEEEVGILSWALNTGNPPSGLSFSAGDKIHWQVKTKGLSATYSDYSVMRDIELYAPPTLSISAAGTLSSFPYAVSVNAGPSSQSILSLNLTITSNSSYEYENYLGNTVFINAGSEIFSKIYYPTTNNSTINLAPDDLTLKSGQSYKMTGVVNMSSGMLASSTIQFTVSIPSEDIIIDAGILVNSDSLVAGISPSCTYDDAAREGQLVPNTSMEVYRINADGNFTRVAKGIPNDLSTTVIDPHPSLYYASYRVIARNTTTGLMYYTDLSSEDIIDTAIVIQWDETYSNFNFQDDDLTSENLGSLYSGITLKLPYNVKISESNTMDVSLVEYIGREDPVSYYGTQKGFNGNTWSAEIPRTDTDTLSKLRRLAIWPGDVYVREPSGSGYWAQVAVSFNRDYDSVVVPVSLTVNRVSSDRP